MKRLTTIFFLLFLLIVPVVLVESCDTGLVDDPVVDGKMMFWSNFDGPPIEIYVDGDYSGTISAYFTEEPDCESSGCVTVTRAPGTYSFYAEEQNPGGGTGNTWNGSFTVRANGCGSYTLIP